MIPVKRILKNRPCYNMRCRSLWSVTEHGAKRESGENPELPRSGNRERKARKRTGCPRREAGKRRLIGKPGKYPGNAWKSEDLPAGNFARTRAFAGRLMVRNRLSFFRRLFSRGLADPRAVARETEIWPYIGVRDHPNPAAKRIPGEKWRGPPWR